MASGKVRKCGVWCVRIMSSRDPNYPNKFESKMRLNLDLIGKNIYSKEEEGGLCKNGVVYEEKRGVDCWRRVVNMRAD